MAGPSEISGVQPGIVPGKRGGDFSGVADTVTKMMQQFVQMHENKKVIAGQNLERMMKMVESGFPIDPKAITKAAKDAGMPVMKPDDMKAGLMGPQQGQPQQPQQKVDPTQPQQGNPDSKNIGAIKDSGFKKEQFKAAALDHWYQGAMARAQVKGMTDQALLEYGQKVAELRKQAADGDNNSLGQLMKLNEIPFSIDKVIWDQATDKQKQGMIDVAAGRETEKEFNNRRDHIMDNLLTSGRFKDPDIARRAADAMAHGTDLPSDVKSAMTPNSYSDLMSEAGFMGTLIELGVPPDKAPSVAKAAAVGGLQNALPTGLKPLAIQRMQEEQKRTQIEAGRVGLEATKFQAETEHWKAMAAAADAKAKEEGAKAMLDRFKSLVEMKKGGVQIEQSVLDAAQADFAKTMGLDVKEVNNFFHFLTGGTHLEFAPKPATDVVKSVVGAKPDNKNITPGVTDRIKKMMKSLRPPQDEDQQ